MTDYSHIVTDDLRVLDGAANGGTPYEMLHLVIDEGGDVRLIDLRYYGGDTIQWGRDRVYTLASAEGSSGIVIDLRALRTDLADGGWLSKAIAAIKAGHSVGGRLTKEAREAEESLTYDLMYERRYIDMSWAVWDVGDYLVHSTQDITADMTDDQIVAWAAMIVAIAADDHVILKGDVAEWAREVRAEKLAEQQQEEID